MHSLDLFWNTYLHVVDLHFKDQLIWEIWIILGAFFRIHLVAHKNWWWVKNECGNSLFLFFKSFQKPHHCLYYRLHGKGRFNRRNAKQNSWSSKVNRFTNSKSCLTGHVTFFYGHRAVVYLNFSKAFDTVSHRMALWSVRQVGSCLADCTQGFCSGWQPIPTLGATLFSIFINDLGGEIESTLTKFANDTEMCGEADTSKIKPFYRQFKSTLFTSQRSLSGKMGVVERQLTYRLSTHSTWLTKLCFSWQNKPLWGKIAACCA